MDQQEINALLELADEYIDVGEQALPKLLDVAGKLRPVFEQLTDFTADLMVRSVDRMESKGLSRDEAVTLTAAARAGMLSAIKSAKQ